ncbi:MAG: hypothetical protein AAFR74_02390 [Pseudomonadota bacterium]
MATLDIQRQDIFRLTPRAKTAPIAFPFGLGVSGVHEICEARHGDLPALFGFSLAANTRRPGAVLYVQQWIFGIEHGDILHAGAERLQSQVNPILSVYTRRTIDALWAVEEGIKSAAVGLVLAEIEDCAFTASRRLVLASHRHGVPVILLMPYTREGATAATARWRVQPQLSAYNEFDPRGLGAARWHAVLERSRQAPQMAGQSYDLEWNDETLSLTMVSGLASHQIETRADKPSDPSGQSQLLRYG